MFRLSLFGRFSLTDASGADVPVTSKKGKALLAYLAQTPGKPRSREEILALLWSDRAEAQGRASLRQVLAGLRRKVGEELLRIDRDSLVLDADIFELTPANGQEFLSGFHLTDPAFEEWLRDTRLRLENTEAAQASSASSAREKPTIAVLPFENLSSDPDQVFFSDGVTQDIMTELSRFDDLIILSPKATFQFRDSDMSSMDVGEKLAATYLAEGSVRQAGNRVRISAQLTDAGSGSQLWAERYDRDVIDVFEIQEEVARQIAATIPGRSAAHSFNRVTARSHLDLTAYQYVLRSDWLSWNNFGSQEVPTCLEKQFPRIHPMRAPMRGLQTGMPIMSILHWFPSRKRKGRFGSSPGRRWIAHLMTQWIFPSWPAPICLSEIMT